MTKYLLSIVESCTSRKFVVAISGVFFSIAHTIFQFIPGKPRCPVCGALLICVYRPVLSKKLIDEWNLTADWEVLFNRRDGEICISCGGSIRGRQMGLALVNWINRARGADFQNAQAAFLDKSVRMLRIAEINSCGGIHKILNRLPYVSYSEYEPYDQRIRHEDLLGLSYGDESFDIALHSDTLEHIPDIDRALSEIWRVLKPGGAMIFSIPIVRDGRPTLVRAKLGNRGIKQFYPPSYHGGSYQTTSQYLVCYEFGEDFMDLVKSHGFKVELLEYPENPAAVTFTAIKPSL